MVRGSGWGPPTGRWMSCGRFGGASCHRREPVRWGLSRQVTRPASSGHPDGLLVAAGEDAIVQRMTLITAPRSAPRFGTIVGGTMIGVLLVLAGLATAYLMVATPIVSLLVPGAPYGGRGVGIGLGIWSFAMVAGGALLVAGTNRLAMILAMLKTRDRPGGPAARALASMPDDAIVVSAVQPDYGRPIPELVIGSFGAAVIHELPSSRLIRRGNFGWEVRTSFGWAATDDPLELAIRDAERIRHWLGGADLDFVVRVYAALVVSDVSVVRLPACAVISADQIPAWIAALPRQRSLTVGRLGRLLALSQPPTSVKSGDADRGW